LATLVLPPLPEIIARYQAGETYAVLAAEFGCSQWSLRDRFKKAGVTSRKPGVSPGSRKGWYCVAELDEAAVVTAYNNFIPKKLIAQTYGVHEKTIQRCLRRLGVAGRPAWKYRCNRDYFETIDTEETAYWLGMLMADGCVTYRTGRHCVRLLLKDKEHVEKFAAAMETDAPISIISRISKKTGKAQTYYCLAIGSSKMCRDLMRHGVVPRKTCNHGTPTLAPGLMRHFYRGYVDGDGCLRWTHSAGPSAQAQFYVTGHLPFLEGMQDWLGHQIGRRLTAKIQPTKSKIAYRIGLGGNFQVGLICKVLYGAVTTALDRKHAIALDMMS
jgi:hypothetical protein